MKATLEFNLDDPDDRMSHLRCVKSLDMAITLWIIKTNLRRYLQVSEENEEFYELVKESISNILTDEGINLDELIV